MTRITPDKWERLAGICLLGVSALHASTKTPATRIEMLWMCHVASMVLAAGLLTGSGRAVALGFLIAIGVGVPGYVADLLSGSATTPTSVLAHAAPVAVGVWQVRRHGWLPGLLLPAWLSQFGLVVSCYWLTPAELNVNLSHHIPGSLGVSYPQAWESWISFGMLSVLLLSATNFALSRIDGLRDRKVGRLAA